MSLAPLLAAPPSIQIHAGAALALLPITSAQFAPQRGNRWHRWMGSSWVSLMSLGAVTSFWLQEIRLIGGFSPIHLLSVLTLGALCYAIHMVPPKTPGDPPSCDDLAKLWCPIGGGCLYPTADSTDAHGYFLSLKGIL